MHFEFKLENLGRIERRLFDSVDMFKSTLDQGLYYLALGFLGECNQEVPVDTGTLMRSGEVQGPEDDGVAELTVRIGYGYGDELNPRTLKPARDYAVEVHEDLRVTHGGYTLKEARSMGPHWETRSLGGIKQIHMKKVPFARFIKAGVMSKRPKAKFLEDPFQRWQHTFLRDLANMVKSLASAAQGGDGD